MSIRIYDPTEQSRPYEDTQLATRPQSLRGLRVGLLQNQKRNSAQILERLGKGLQRRHEVAECSMRPISTGTLFSNEFISDVKSTCDVAVIGVGD